jgi:hypothetical protein
MPLLEAQFWPFEQSCVLVRELAFAVTPAERSENRE